MHDDFCVFTRLAETAGELRCLDDRALRDLFSRWIAHDHVRAGIIACVHPEIVWLRDSKRQVVVVTRGAADENLVTISRKITTNAGQLLSLGDFFAGVFGAGAGFSKPFNAFHLATQ